MPNKADQLADAISDLDIVENSLLPDIRQLYCPGTKKIEFTTIKTTSYPYSVIRTVRYLNKQNELTTLYIKRITIPNKEPNIVEQALLKEDRLLRILNKDMAGETVEHIATFPEQQSIVTKECPGTPTDLLLNRYSFWWMNTRQKQVLRNNIPALCGSWLKRFHSFTEEKDLPLTPWYDYLSGEIIWRTRMLKAMKPSYSKLLESCSKQFREELKELESSGLTHLYHGDFAPHNIFYSNQKIRVIDFYGAKVGHALMDLINFIASIAIRLESPFYPHWRVRNFCTQFLTHYGSIPAIDPRLPVLLLILQSVKRLLVIAQNSASGSVPPLVAYSTERQYISYLENYRQNNEKALKIGPWRCLDLSSLENLSTSY